MCIGAVLLCWFDRATVTIPSLERHQVSMTTTPTPPQNKIVRIILAVFAVIFTVALLLYFFDIVTGYRFMVTGGRSNSGINLPEDFWIIAVWIIGAVVCWWAVFRVQHSKYLNKKIFNKFTK